MIKQGAMEGYRVTVHQCKKIKISVASQNRMCGRRKVVEPECSVLSFPLDGRGAFSYLCSIRDCSEGQWGRTWG